MIILSHRGLWDKPSEKNTKESFIKSFNYGFGVETDLRDINRRIVVSHDPPLGDEMTFEEFIKVYVQCNQRKPLALNVKSDGLQEMAGDILNKYSITEYFFFDMSIPDSLVFLDKKLNFFTRISDIEKTPLLLDHANGVWMDFFYNEWITKSDIVKFLVIGKKVCLVSPELHQKHHLPFWNQLRQWDVINNQNLYICTDYPQEASKYFL
jgi:hypothetical protein